MNEAEAWCPLLVRKGRVRPLAWLLWLPVALLVSACAAKAPKEAAQPTPAPPPTDAPADVGSLPRLSGFERYSSLKPATTAGSEPLHLPVRVEIPSVGIDAPVEQVGLTPDTALGSAHSDTAVAWFSEGWQLGESGNSILNGHVVTHKDGRPAGLWRLDQVRPEDEVVLILQDGTRFRYNVTEIDDNNVDKLEGERIARIFGRATTENLNIISHGYGDPATGTDKRVVVYSTRALR